MQRKIKICALTTISKTMDWFVVESMRNLANNGYDVTLVCDMDQDFITRNSDFAKCVPVKMSRGIDFKGAINGIKTFYKLFKENQFDIIQYSTPNAALYSSIAGTFAKIPVRLYGQWGIRYVTFGGIKRFIFKTLEKITCLFSTHVRAQSFKNRQFAINEGLCKEDKISVIGIGGTIGVDFNEFDINKKSEYRKETRETHNISDDDFVFGFVGRLNVDKGINELIEAFAEIDNAKLMLVGMLDDNYGPSKRNLELAKNNPNVIITGNVPPNEVPKYISCFDILVHPTYREGFGKVLQESMAMGTPIITTDVPGPSEVIENDVSGILVPVKDSAALRNEMLSLMEDNERRNRYVKSARERAEKYFERSIMLQNILDEYNKILEIDRKEEVKI